MAHWKMISKIFVITAVIFFVATNAAVGEDPKEKLRLQLPQQDIPQPQMFCGYCHILTYPNIVQQGYELWKKDKHNNTGCVECHYPPKEGVDKRQDPSGGTEPVSNHIPKKAPDRFSYIPLGTNTVLQRPRILDASCMTSNCHGKPDDKFKTKKIKFTEKVIFEHEPHLDKKKQIEGQAITCTGCHQHETDKKKFEVSQASCHLCHFKNVKFNEKRGRCELCHELPKKPIQTSGQEPITHEMLKDAKVSCGGCHYEMIQSASGVQYEAQFEGGILKTALVLKAGEIKRESCQSCHDKEKELKEVTNKKLMHQKHVTVKTARCFDCHRPIQHTAALLKQTKEEQKNEPTKEQEKKFHSALMRDRFIQNGCMTCHPEPHRLQRLLAVGLKSKDVPETRDFHLKAMANCMACHIEETVTKKGEKVLTATEKACVSCHKGRKNLLKDWKTDLDNGIKETLEIEQEALEAMAKAKGKLSKEKRAKAEQMIEDGRKNLNMVRYGNGVHNKKYSMFVLDAAMTRFEDLLDDLEDSD